MEIKITKIVLLRYHGTRLQTIKRQYFALYDTFPIVNTLAKL